MHFGKKFGTGKRASYKRDIFLFDAKDVWAMKGTEKKGFCILT